MPQVIILAGPNGAGKTTFATEYLPAAGRSLVYVNADEIARDPSFSAFQDAPRDMQAGRAMLRNIAELVAQRADFMFETTLASLSYARKISEWQKLGYAVGLIYFRLPDAAASVDRVRRRRA